VITLALLLICGLVGFIAGTCYEGCRRGGSLDLQLRVCELDLQKSNLVRLLAAATNPHQVPAQRQVHRA
jgi:hypothetical protein